jgi:hypothetical protein
MSNNYKSYNLLQAKKQFLEDLKLDNDFVEYKRNSHKNNRTYGTVIVGQGYCIDCLISSEQIISNFTNKIYYLIKNGDKVRIYRRNEISRYKNKFYENSNH